MSFGAEMTIPKKAVDSLGQMPGCFLMNPPAGAPPAIQTVKTLWKYLNCPQ